jgi:hypothetical protein
MAEGRTAQNGVSLYASHSITNGDGAGGLLRSPARASAVPRPRSRSPRPAHSTLPDVGHFVGVEKGQRELPDNDMSDVDERVITARETAGQTSWYQKPASSAAHHTGNQEEQPRQGHGWPHEHDRQRRLAAPADAYNHALPRLAGIQLALSRRRDSAGTAAEAAALSARAAAIASPTPIIGTMPAPVGRRYTHDKAPHTLAMTATTGDLNLPYAAADDAAAAAAEATVGGSPGNIGVVAAARRGRSPVAIRRRSLPTSGPAHGGGGYGSPALGLPGPFAYRSPTLQAAPRPHAALPVAATVGEDARAAALADADGHATDPARPHFSGVAPVSPTAAAEDEAGGGALLAALRAARDAGVSPRSLAAMAAAHAATPAEHALARRAAQSPVLPSEASFLASRSPAGRLHQSELTHSGSAATASATIIETRSAAHAGGRLGGTAIRGYVPRPVGPRAASPRGAFADTLPVDGGVPVLSPLRPRAVPAAPAAASAAGVGLQPPAISSADSQAAPGTPEAASEWPAPPTTPRRGAAGDAVHGVGDTGPYSWVLNGAHLLAEADHAAAIAAVEASSPRPARTAGRLAPAGEVGAPAVPQPWDAAASTAAASTSVALLHPGQRRPAPPRREHPRLRR